MAPFFGSKRKTAEFLLFSLLKKHANDSRKSTLHQGHLPRIGHCTLLDGVPDTPDAGHGEGEAAVVEICFTYFATGERAETLFSILTTIKTLRLRS